METFNDITREMREGPVHACFVTEVGAASDANRKFRDFADRIETAYKRELKAVVDLNETAMKTATDEVARLRAENELLRSAIVRVHGCLDSTCGSMGVCRTCEFMRIGGAE